MPRMPAKSFQPHCERSTKSVQSFTIPPMNQYTPTSQAIQMLVSAGCASRRSPRPMATMPMTSGAHHIDSSAPVLTAVLEAAM